MNRRFRRGDVTKHQGWTESDPWSWVSTVHDGLHVVAAGEESRNRVPVLVQYTRVVVGDDAGRHAKIRWKDGDSEKGRVFDRGNTGVRCMVAIAHVSLVSIRTSTKCWIVALSGVFVEFAHCLNELLPWNIGLAPRVNQASRTPRRKAA